MHIIDFEGICPLLGIGHKGRKALELSWTDPFPYGKGPHSNRGKGVVGIKTNKQTKNHDTITVL